jgi:hypothetical protein
MLDASAALGHLPDAGPLLVDKVVEKLWEASHAADRVQQDERVYNLRIELAHLQCYTYSPTREAGMS